MATKTNLIQNALYSLNVKTACSCEESYIRCVEYGKTKASYKSPILFGKAIMAGIFVGLCAHASGIAGGLFYYYKLREIVGTSFASFIYSFTFPIALLCIIATGSDLFTGNTMAVTTALLQRQMKITTYLRVMSISLLGNYVGAIFSAVVISYGSGAYRKEITIEKNHIFLFLNYMAYKKVTHSFIECISLGIGCNLFVCLSVYFVLTIKDGAGLVFSVFFAVYSFAIAGYEHIIANMFTLNLALLVKTEVSFIEVYVYNLLPTLIGNCIAGALVLALPLFLIYRHYYEQFETSNLQAEGKTLKQLSIIMDNEEAVEKKESKDFSEKRLSS